MKLIGIFKTDHEFKNIILIFFASFYFPVFAQIEGNGSDSTNDYEKYKKLINREFADYKENIDKEFADYLKQKWQAFDIYKDEKIGSDKPKPSEQPKAPEQDTIGINDNKPKNEIEVPIVEPKPIKPKPEQTPLPKPCPIKEPTVVQNKSCNVNYLGYNFSFSYNPMIDFPLKGNANYDIADAWSFLNDGNYQVLLNDLLNTKNKYNLNDWAYFELVNKVSTQIFSNSKEKQTILTWFLLNKSNYLTRIAKQGEGIALLIAYTENIYNHSYIEIDGVKFYFIYEPDENKQPYTYAKNYSSATRKIDANINKPILFASNNTKKTLSYKYGCKTYFLNVDYNKNAISFYKSLPFFDIPIYADALPSVNLEYSLISEVKKLVEGKSEKLAVDMILQFVQKAFKYKTDQDQFGVEKYFFAEELFHYEFSDCEDRSVLFAYLVRKVLGLKVVGLIYPGHMATAVKFTSNVNGDYITYEGTQYVVCDPTYVGAHIGMAMPEYKKVNATIVPLKNIK
ncbi:MAG: hypothetical protein JXR60_00115 [Bacteroidales bacterium]|nr:hypothetical protein [Bacteroidales bacterium]